MYHIKEDKRSLQSSQWIYNALEELMIEKDYSEISVTDIVNKANLGRTTFYRNFDTIDDVLRMKCNEEFIKLREYLTEYYKQLKTKKIFFLKPFLRYWYIDSKIIELLIKAKKEYIIKESFIELINFFTDTIPNKPSAISDHYNYFVELRIAISISILSVWIKNDKNIPPDDLSEIIVEQFRNPLNLELPI